MSPNENKNEFQTTELKVGSEKTIIVRSSFSSRKICWFIAFLLVMLFLIAVFCVFISINTERPDTKKVLSILEEQINTNICSRMICSNEYLLKDDFHGKLDEQWRNGSDR